MLGPLRRWRPLIAVAATWLLLCWFFYADDSSVATPPFRFDTGGSSSSTSGGSSSSSSVPQRWKKHPDHHPVASLRALPTGPPPVRIPNVQRFPPPSEDKIARRVREERLAAVKESFRHSWEGYKTHAWMSDEVGPLSGRRKDPFGGWAATLVDALDTLWILGMKDEFKEAVRAAEEIDFATTQTASINVFETTIRYLGGFLAAYELSEKQYPSLLLKAVEVGELLMGAFDTPNRMPISRWSWQDYVADQPQVAPKTILVSEIGSLTLEFTKLSELTGEMKYYDAVQRISDEFEKSQDTTMLPGMWPIVVDAANLAFDTDGSFTLGGMSDSLYEYFPKQYLLLGGRLEQPKKMYEKFIEVAKKHFFRRAMNPEDVPILISGDVRVSGEKPNLSIDRTPKGQHLTCFVGGMVGLGARIFNREQDLDVAIQLTNGCVWTYNSTASGIGPEIFHYVPCGGIEDKQTDDACMWDEIKWHDAVRMSWHPVDEGKGGITDEQVDEIIRTQRLPPGMPDVDDHKYILRPEAIESVFIMYRITGDPRWMDRAWDMFLHIEQHTHTGIAAASLEDITLAKPKQVDSMESFWLAETLKYFYLIYSDWEVVNLDKWVLNTEAHPLKRPVIEM